jgi:hypothetical protein
VAGEWTTFVRRHYENNEHKLNAADWTLKFIGALLYGNTCTGVGSSAITYTMRQTKDRLRGIRKKKHRDACIFF